jgi:coenzyme F420-reducing hydrogenase beta subunit
MEPNNITRIDKNVCTGCGLCTEKCPPKCISMQMDGEGFFAPVVDESLCANCGRCLRICPTTAAADRLYYQDEREYFASIISHKETLLKSSSGGVFGVLADYVLQHGGYVCGCVYNADMQAEHMIANRREDVERMFGSKYVQSRANQCFAEIKRLLEEGNTVLFTGTACQVAALRLYLGGEYEKLLCVEILCHGVPSPGLFGAYVKHLEKKLGGRVLSVQFRNKEKHGWGSEHRTCVVYQKNGRQKKYRPILPAYFSAFFYGLNLRESCYRCRFAKPERVADWTIGDFWGYWVKYKRRFTEGISVVGINSQKGKQLAESVRGRFVFYDPLTQKEAVKSNDNFEHPVKRPHEREDFYNAVDQKGYKGLWKKTYLGKTHRKKILASIYGAFVPAKIRFFIRKLRII